MQVTLGLGHEKFVWFQHQGYKPTALEQRLQTAALQGRAWIMFTGREGPCCGQVSPEGSCTAGLVASL